jgi:hypothetical protein
MAKKKKKVAQPASRSGSEDATASGSAATCTAGELDTPRAVLGTAEGLSRAVDYVHFDINWAVSVFPVSMQHVPARERVTGEENARLNSFVLQAQREFEANDTGETPYRRVVGKVVEVLTVHRRHIRNKDHCSVGDVFLVFLTEIPQHSPYLPEDYRRVTPTQRGNTFAVTRDPGKTGIAGRLRDLKERGWLAAATTTRSGGERGYRLSDDGRVLFDGWPNVEGLSNTPPPPQSATE